MRQERTSNGAVVNTDKAERKRIKITTANETRIRSLESEVERLKVRLDDLLYKREVKTIV